MELPTWTMGGVGGPEITEKMVSDVITDVAVLEVVNRQLDEFIKAFKGANSPTHKAQNTITIIKLSNLTKGL